MSTLPDSNPPPVAPEPTEALPEEGAAAGAPAEKRMFRRLVASEGGRHRSWNSKTAVLSLVVHGLLLAGAVYGSTQVAREVTERNEELVTFTEIAEPEPEPEAPEPPPPPPPEETPKPTPPVPKGYQELIPPEAPPPDIPPPDLSAPAVKAEDFSGIGIAGGTAQGDPTVKEAPPEPVTDPSSQPGFAYEVAQLEQKPELANKSQVASAMQRLYPRMLQDAGIGGTVMMQFVIEPNGQVDVSSVKVMQSSHEQLADASRKAVERFRFRPGKYKGQAVRVLIQMPITWQPQ